MIRRAALACCLLLLLPAVSCSDSQDPQLLEEIGLARLFLIDPDLDQPTLEDLEPPPGSSEPETPVQVAEWKVLQADLEIGDVFVDLLVGEGCRFTHTPLVTPVADGICEEGIVIESSEDGTEVRLVLEVELRLRRVEPDKVLPAEEDFDLDLALNGVDNCPLIYNPGQEDTIAPGDGVGDACTTVDAFLNPARDSDGDGVADESDNCVWEYNPSQENTQGSFKNGDLIPDGIGDACREQTAYVEAGGAERFQLILGPTDLTLPVGGITFITVDFGNETALEHCNWVTGSCELNPDRVGFCAPTTGSQALAGCPDQP